MALNLTTKPEIVTRQFGCFVYLEKFGPFMKSAPIAWQEFWSIADSQLDKTQISAMMGLSLIDNSKEGDAAYTCS